MVTINSGDLPSAVGKEGHELAQVVHEWQKVAHGRFPDDCSKLQQMIEETDRLELWTKPVGGSTFKSRNEFLQKKVLINFDLTEANISKIVRLLKGGEVEAVQAAIKAANKNPLPPSDQSVNPRNPNGRKGKESNDNINRLKGGTDTTYTLRRLARDKPELLDKIESGELSVNAAAISAGIRRKPTPEEVCVKAFGKVENRLNTLKRIVDLLAPHERAVVRDWLEDNDHGG
jgi:hypothetical protein